MAAFIIVSLSPRGSWVSLLPFQNAIRIQSHGFVPREGHCVGPIHCIHLWVTIELSLTTEVPVTVTLTSLLLHSSHKCCYTCQAWHHITSHWSILQDNKEFGFSSFSIELQVHLSCTFSTATLQAKPLCYVSSGVSFGNISRSCCWSNLVSTAATETLWKSQLISL